MDVVDVSIDDLRRDSANPRRISAEQASALTRSLEQFGFPATIHERFGPPRCSSSALPLEVPVSLSG